MMNQCLMASCLVVLTLVGLPVGAQPALSGSTLTLTQAVDLALSRGDDVVVQTSTLDAARAARDLANGKNGFTVSTSLSYAASQSANSPGNTSSTTYAPAQATALASTTPAAGSATPDGIVLQSPTASITLGTPLTSVTAGWSTGLETWPDGTSRVTGTASAKLTQTLWNGYWGGPSQAAADKGALAYQIAQWNAQAARNKTVLAVKQAFFTVLSAQDNLSLLRTTLASRKTSLQFAQAKYDLKQATDIDLMTAQVNEGSAELDLVDGENALNIARQRLSNLLGLATDSNFVVQREPDPAPPSASLEEAIALGKKNRTELLVASANARSAEIDRALALGSATPSLAVTAGVTNVLDLSASKGVVVGQVGVTLGAPLWDGGQAGSSYAQADRARATYLTQIHQLGRSIPVDIQEGWNAWVQAQKRYEIAVVNQKNFNLQLAVTKAQLDAGSKTLADEFTAEINASSAQFGLLKAKIAVQLAALQVQSLLGL